MARALTPQEGYAILNLVAKQATGRDNIATVNSSNFVSVGETILATGYENTLNSLAIVMGRTIMAVRPYKAKLQLIQALNTGMYTSRLRKLSVYPKDAKAAGFVNTNINPQNLYNGYENTSATDAVGSQWEQDKPAVAELTFGGSTVWDFQQTIYEVQLKAAFRDETEWLALLNGIMTERLNDIETQKEAFNRLNLLNLIAGVYDLNAAGSVINLTDVYNATYGTTFTTAQILQSHMKELLELFVVEFKNASDFMSERTASYHVSPTKTIDGVTYDTLLRHTPKNKQKAILYAPFINKAKAMVMPEIFNTEYLDLKNYEGITYWQSQNDRMAIDVTPAIPDFTTGAQKAGDNVKLDYVLGALFDTDAIMTDFQFESADSTPVEARKKYRNIWYHNSKNAICDFTENAVIFIMANN